MSFEVGALVDSSTGNRGGEREGPLDVRGLTKNFLSLGPVLPTLAASSMAKP